MESQISKPRILVAVMTGIKDPTWQLGVCIPEIAKDPRADITVLHFISRPTEENRNRAVKKTLDDGYDFMFMIDPDTVPKSNPIDLAFLNLDIVGMPYPQWRNDGNGLEIAFLAMDKKEDGNYLDHKTRVGLREVDAVGSGAMLVHRRVLEKVRPAFVRLWDENGFAVKGIDFNFCDRAKAEGFRVWAHFDYLADHIKELSLLDVLDFKYGNG